MDTLVLTCMDPRLNRYLDDEYLSDSGKKKYGSVEIWRNASGRLPLMEELVKSGARRIILAPHTDCKAKEYMYNTLRQEVSESHRDQIVSQASGLVKGKDFSTREEFDKLVNEEEETFLRGKVANAGIEVVLRVVDISKITVPAHAMEEKMLVISSETGATSERIAARAGVSSPCCYIIQGPYLKELSPDINLALGLGIRRLDIITESSMPFR